MRPLRIHIIPRDWVDLERQLNGLTKWFVSQGLTEGSSPTFAGLTLTGLTASRLIATNSGKELTSVANLASWVAGTTNEITITNDGDGTITASLANIVDFGLSN